jgi:hypothetical protein
MSFDFYLYRAAQGLGSLLEWEEDHAEPLGLPSELRVQIDAAFPSLQWTENPDGSWTATDASETADLRELSIRSTQGQFVQFIVTYASPPALRTLMTTLKLNYCCAPESGELRDPFSVRDAWGSA